jgi:hypothetical protein
METSNSCSDVEDTEYNSDAGDTIRWGVHPHYRKA